MTWRTGYQPGRQQHQQQHDREAFEVLQIGENENDHQISEQNADAAPDKVGASAGQCIVLVHGEEQHDYST